MDPSDAAAFYTGIVARIYAPLRSVDPDPEPYAQFVAASGEPALELGCGDGDPLLDLRARGLDVEGLDSSADMVDRCRAAAAGRGLDVTVHHQSMAAMALDRTFRSIYLAGPTFNLLPDDATAARALERIRAHLVPGGSALIPLFLPTPTPAEDLGRVREHTTDDGTVMRVAPVAEERDEEARRQTTVMRYELASATGTVAEERPWVLHWHTQDGFLALAAAAGLTVAAVLAPDARPAAPDADAFVFWLTAPAA